MNVRILLSSLAFLWLLVANQSSQNPTDQVGASNTQFTDQNQASGNSSRSQGSSQQSSAQIQKSTVTLDGEVRNQSTVTLKSSGSQLQVLPTYFSQMFNFIGNQNIKMRIIYYATDKDTQSGEIVRKSILQVTDDAGKVMYVGAVEYPMRDSVDEQVPRFMQSQSLEEVLGFVSVSRKSLSEAKALQKEFSGFERGEASGKMCAKCSVRTEVLSEDEQVHKFSLRIDILNVRLAQLLETIRVAQGQAKLDALSELKTVKAQITALEQKKLERELEIERQKEAKRKEQESVFRAKVEKEIWARIGELAKVKAGEWRSQAQAAGKTLSGLERAWLEQNEKVLSEKAEFDKVSAQVKELTAKLNELKRAGQTGQGDIELINKLNKQIQHEKKGKRRLEPKARSSLNWS